MKIKTFLYKKQIPLSIIALIAGLFLFILGLFEVVLTDYSPALVSDMGDVVGDWIYWFLVIGGFLTLIFGWLIIDRFKKMKEFKDLVETESKSKFIKNIARIETLALSLGPQYEDKVIEKEEEFNINR
ncbi:MAG: DUF3198 domain-containing protein [Thermoplasmatota archaeon]